MQKLDRYLLGEFAQAIFATLVVLLIVMIGGAFIDVLGDIARGRLPASMTAAQLGFVLLTWLPVIMPLALMLGLLMAMSRLYRDAEMPVLTSIGVGPKRLLKPLMMVTLPLVALIALCSLWLGPWADRTSRAMIREANRNLLITGLEAGRFTELPGGGGVVYVGEMEHNGSKFKRIFIYRQQGDRLDVTTAAEGELTLDGARTRYLSLGNGFEVEGPMAGGDLDYRLLRFVRNDVRMPDRENDPRANDPRRKPTLALLGDPAREARAQLHWRIAPPLIALGLALLAVPLSRSPPRQARYGRMVTGFLGYLVSIQLMLLGTDLIAKGKLPAALGLWWLLLPVLALGVWFYSRDGRLPRRRLAR
ncbi:LPS export ABC transporter permease LptF [Lysobacter pythonis]|uniref:Lipopolysaccharide export system permease protein LptF n=1 Tax=Solilutibacter pythonis TaxID=2483112 RepID=A0A3M2HUA1_9GAMM|nr:LPS export ABC transporter permease LptF [Lysobacter pythonis]RMH93316.1 LPS export ABC transporter permease LptF [Lysobacter pythonis]